MAWVERNIVRLRCSSRRAHGIDLFLKILGIVVGRIRTYIVTSRITQYAVDNSPQSLSVAFVDADLAAPVTVVLIVVK